MLTGELLAKVRKIEIKTRKLVEEITGGAYHSVFKGRGIEFSEVREYMNHHIQCCKIYAYRPV